jgi:hypothetical protein
MKSRSQGRAALLSCVVLATSGCHLLSDRAPPGETRTAQGKVYHSDNPTYDAYFDGVHAVHAQTAEAFDEEAKARAPLEQALGTRNTTPDRLVELTKQRLKAGREGAPVHLAVTGIDPPKDGETHKSVEVKLTVADEAAVPPSQRELVKALEQSAKAEGEVLDKFGLVSTRAKSLLAHHGQLVASVNKDFTTPSRRDEVVHELDASKPVLGEAAGRAEKVTIQARSFLKGMSDMLAGVEAAPPKDEKGAQGKPAAKPKNGGPAPKRAAPPPKPVHKAPPPETPHAEPAPKPSPPPKAPGEEFNP